jgi:ATP-dependent Clp protease protease subunit
MDKAKAQLDAVKENIINAYQLKTRLPREKLSDLMTAETTLTARQAVTLGFADKILYAEGVTFEDAAEPVIFSRAAVTNSFLSKFRTAQQKMEPAPGTKAMTDAELLQKAEHPPKEGSQSPVVNDASTPIESLYKRLDLLNPR